MDKPFIRFKIENPPNRAAVCIAPDFYLNVRGSGYKNEQVALDIWQTHIGEWPKFFPVIALKPIS